MKKPWRFTPKQIRRDYGKNHTWGQNFNWYSRYEWKKIQKRNRQQLWLQLNNWVEDGIYRNSHRNNASWNYW